VSTTTDTGDQFSTDFLRADSFFDKLLAEYKALWMARRAPLLTPAAA